MITTVQVNLEIITRIHVHVQLQHKADGTHSTILYCNTARYSMVMQGLVTTNASSPGINFKRQALASVPPKSAMDTGVSCHPSGTLKE